jgi:hypothetical protein
MEKYTYSSDALIQICVMRPTSAQLIAPIEAQCSDAEN